ncbi:MAG: hypothetical protein HY063_06165 [Bacteroidetes bacterium]|nr:hypothetical protein [Bacteroidota bacterium]
MKRFYFFSLLLFLFITLSGVEGFSQDEEEQKPFRNLKGAKGFHAGIYLGSLFANKNTSNLYDGWGYDENGKRNDFLNSFMYRRIVNDFGGGNGLTDQVAAALGVDHTGWTFDQTDMPINMKYNSAFMFGFQMNFGFTKKDVLIVNVNASKLSLSGNFSIQLTNPQVGYSQPNYENLKTFSIAGGEQRLIIQAGYRRILGENSSMNFFVEGGPLINYTKYIKNQIAINNLVIDLSFYYMQPYFATYHASYLRGTGLGTFTGFGLNIAASEKWTLQLLYNPSLEKINIGENPKLALQHSAGARIFYNL